MTGQVLGERYEILQQLGKKAGRKTYLSRDQVTQELVVIKLLAFNNDFEWDDLKLFEREAETLQSLSHPAIPRYLNHFELQSEGNQGFALVQSYIDARSLEEQLKAGRVFNETDVCQIAKALLEILIYLHGQNPPVIHRDIKPSNILLTNRSGNSVGEVYLVDFGSVQTLAAKEGGTITIVGTYGYMPPEQFGGRTVPASDLYSLGATLIYLVTGLHPADLPQADMRIQFEQAANLNPNLTTWLQQMTEPSLNRRLANAQDALQALEHPQLNRGYLKGDTLHPVRQQPIGSKVVLTEEGNRLHIVIPPEGLRWQVLLLLSISLVWDALIVISLPSVVPFFLQVLTELSLFGLLMILFFWGTGTFLLIKVLFRLFGRVHLQLDSFHLQLTCELFGFKFRYANLPRSIICKLLHSRYHLRPARNTEVSAGNYIRERDRIIIWGGTRSYEFCSESVLTEPELDWLAYKLSEALGLPVAKD
ncbi:serine/threonine protein kinase [Leptolyngbya sp. 'hensonii']|uniref:serine/threonine protein kinase n=1 Tax=Leptolyngbya sp. 'hensonii' TaxID=1922337 RepID=UPI0009502C19|nr:serine/threonine-protein kinase [Leptolyngbya sp. 'hensonii']OLP16237.1 serine/threonine protein kinase [Leptolyngbya sp. 'hensonii']